MDEAPVEGGWYETDASEVFMVVEVDAVSGRIDVQYLDGTVEQFDRDTWAGLNLIEIEPADEWRETMDANLRGGSEEEM